MAGRLKTLIALAALAGVAGCAYQDPLELPDPYARGPGGGSYDPFYYGSGSPGYY